MSKENSPLSAIDTKLCRYRSVRCSKLRCSSRLCPLGTAGNAQKNSCRKLKSSADSATDGGTCLKPADAKWPTRPSLSTQYQSRSSLVCWSSVRRIVDLSAVERQCSAGLRRVGANGCLFSRKRARECRESGCPYGAGGVPRISLRSILGYCRAFPPGTFRSMTAESLVREEQLQVPPLRFAAVGMTELLVGRT